MVKKHQKRTKFTSPAPRSKSPLDKFQLFYEEIPLQLERTEDVSARQDSDRLSRRSRQ